MTEVDQRIAALEARLEQALAIDARLRALDDRMGAAERAQAPPGMLRGLRDWLQALGPYIAPAVVLILGIVINNSVEDALKREALDLQYASGMRDLVLKFDNAPDQAAADANAIGLAMYGRYAIVPLVDRLEGGDIGPLAAEKGLRMIGLNHTDAACPMFVAVLADRGRRYRWQTQRTVVRLLGQSDCRSAAPALARLAQEAADANGETGLAQFARRFANADDFDQESRERLLAELTLARSLLAAPTP